MIEYFASYGVTVDGIINGIKFDSIVNAQRHNKEVQGDRPNVLPNKIPSKYRISLHIDDEAVVVTQGRNYGFEVFQLEAQDDDWEEKIIERIYAIRKKEIAQNEKLYYASVP